MANLRSPVSGGARLRAPKDLSAMVSGRFLPLRSVSAIGLGAIKERRQRPLPPPQRACFCADPHIKIKGLRVEPTRQKKNEVTIHKLFHLGWFPSVRLLLLKMHQVGFRAFKSPLY